MDQRKPVWLNVHGLFFKDGGGFGARVGMKMEQEAQWMPVPCPKLHFSHAFFNHRSKVQPYFKWKGHMGDRSCIFWEVVYGVHWFRVLMDFFQSIDGIVQHGDSFNEEKRCDFEFE